MSSSGEKKSEPFHAESILISKAIESNDVLLIKSLLRKRNIFCGSNGHDCWLLHEAVQRKKTKIVLTLLRYGVCIESCPSLNNINSALHEAVITGYEPVIVELLRHNADWKKTNKYGQTVLHLAFRSNTLHNSHVSVDKRAEMKEESEKIIVQIIGLFLDLGMDVNVKNKEKNTPLFSAASHRMINVAKYLLERGARIFSDELFLHSLVLDEMESFHREKASIFWNPQRVRCIAQDNVVFLDWLLSKGLDVDRKDHQGKTALQLAVENNLVHILPSLLRYTTDLNFQGQGSKTMLHIFLKANPKNATLIIEKMDNLELSNRYQNIENIAKIMINKGAPIDVADDVGTTPCILAAMQKRKELLKFMLERSSNPRVGRSILKFIVNNWVDRSGRHEVGNDEIISLVISRGLLFNHRENDVMLIPYAIKHKLQKTLNALRVRSADFKPCSVQGKNLLHLAISQLSSSRKKYKDTSFPLSEADAKIEDIVRFAIKAGCDVNGKMKNGETPLHLAAYYGNLELVKILIESGADVDAKNFVYQCTPLHVAVRKNRETLIEVLIQNGADVNAKQRSGKTPLHLAIVHGYNVIAKTLLRLGADVDAEDNRHCSTLKAAFKSKNSSVIEDLLEYAVDTNDIEAMLLPVYNNLGKYDVVWDAFFQHLNKLQDARLPFAKVYQPYLDSYVLGSMDFIEFEETNKLKKFVIEGTVTMYDFLHMNITDRFIYTRHKRFDNLMSWVHEEFPIFHIIIKASYREAVARMSLREPAKRTWLELTGIHLPDLCVERIFHYLTNKNLKVMMGWTKSNTRKRLAESSADELAENFFRKLKKKIARLERRLKNI